MEKMCRQPLVTIGVITYQSADYVLETLDSIKYQTYKNIELIISDDGSNDGTIELCKKWIRENEIIFTNVKLITSSKNTGTSANCNRILTVCKGEWIKLIAGDDIFSPNSISDYVSYINENPNVDVVFAKRLSFIGKFEENNFFYKKLPFEYVVFDPKISASNQYNILKKIYVCGGLASFIKISILKEVGGYDERFRLQEDYPLYIKLTKNGHKLYLLRKYLIYKRVYPESVQYKRDFKDALFSNHKVQCVREYKYMYQYENLNLLWKLMLKYILFIEKMIIFLGNSRKSILCNMLFLFKRFTDPFIWYARYLLLKNKLIGLKKKYNHSKDCNLML